MSPCGLFEELYRQDFCQGGILLFLLCLFDACGGQPYALSLQCGYIEISMRKMYLSHFIHIALRSFIVYT